MNALPLCYLLLHLFLLVVLLLRFLLYVTRLCTTLCARYFRTWPVRYTNGRRTRAELSVATRSRSHRLAHIHVHENGAADVHKRAYTCCARARAHIYTCIRTLSRTRAHVDRCTCPCSARPAVTLNRSISADEMASGIFFRAPDFRRLFLSRLITRSPYFSKMQRFL